MTSFFTLHGDSGTPLRISTVDSRDTTILPVHTSLYKRMSMDCGSVPDSEVEGRMEWSSYASGSCYCLTSRGNPDPEAPRTLRYLKNEAYYYLSLSSADGRVLITDWINHWSESPRVYVGPRAPSASGRKTSSLAGCPKGTILSHRDWKIFEQLCICGGLAEETYCSGFLSCWLCPFVLPLEPHGYMRASVFKMASCMATGTVVSLAIPVLASIYKGLSVHASSANPSVSPCCFPAHYLLVGWRVRFLAFKESTSRSKEYQAWLGAVLSSSSSSSPPRNPKGFLVLPSLGLKRKASPVSVSEDRNPKHVIGVLMQHLTRCLHESGSCTRPSGTSLGTVSVEEHPVCMAVEIINATAAAPPSVQRIESIFWDRLRVAWVELCSLMEGRSYKTPLAEEESIMASFKALA
ncbi:hypothetical protein LIER_16444 [Lithospermum erythrorhizon]|uniref:Uncharacterized protein n=1 Tax=Lithospermum erythrorhizon TaxID=34254 RepID=A0AAV3Q984_LITER